MHFFLRMEIEAKVISEEQSRLWADEVRDAFQLLAQVGLDNNVFHSEKALVQVHFREEGAARAKLENLADLLQLETEEKPMEYHAVDVPILRQIRALHKEAKEITENPLFANDEYARGDANGLERALAELEQRTPILRMPDGSYKAEPRKDE